LHAYSVVCWNLWQITKSYSIISTFDTFNLCHIQRNQLTRPVRRRTGWGRANCTDHSAAVNDQQSY